jgi:DNA-binding MurR/RpiR family transcriptional regulator
MRMITAVATPPSAPASFDELRAAIAARYPEFSPRLRQIAEFALAQPDDLALETVAVVAERAGVQPSALIRFAQALGYDGFSDMQRVFRARLLARSPSYADRLREQASGLGDTPHEVLSHFIAAGHEALDQLQASVEAEALARATTLLAGAEVVHLVAQRRSFPIVSYMAYGLSHLGRRMQLLDGLGGMLAQQARNVTARDALVAASFRPYAEETLAVARQAHGTGAHVVAITDAPLSPLAPFADVVLLVQDAEVRGFRALTASMCLAITLIVGLGQRLVGRDAAKRGF